MRRTRLILCVILMGLFVVPFLSADYRGDSPHRYRRRAKEDEKLEERKAAIERRRVESGETEMQQLQLLKRRLRKCEKANTELDKRLQTVEYHLWPPPEPNLPSVNNGLRR